MAAATTRTRVKRTAFENKTAGYLGAVKIDRKGDEKSVLVAPGDRVFLTQEEVELTEQSHARLADSPFTIREIVHIDPATGDEIARFTAAPLTKVAG